ncbi:alpha/beta fold hydrolase [Paenibacillus dokdonensis]|uniref:alpha/beta fold hydrolase n=1 Tax=Paenibacillus dokdonensis TaxID=2567944 RepID=UPI0010A87DC9|nr:alpha/beta hydrolase [Paenibacillus dokdonensis]
MICRVCEIQDPREIWNEFSNTLNQLGSHKDELYVYGQDKNFFDRLVIASGLSPEEWGKANVHQNKLYSEGLVFESLLNQLDEMECPMLLIKGETDWVSSNNQVQRFLEGKGQKSYVFIEKSGHFPRFERNDVYVNEIRRFVSDL